MINSEEMLDTLWQCIGWEETDFDEIDWDRIHWQKTSWAEAEIDWRQVDAVVDQVNCQLGKLPVIYGLRVTRWHLIAAHAGLWKWDDVADYTARCEFQIGRGLPPTPIEKYMAEPVESDLRYINTVGLMANRRGRPCGEPPSRPDPGRYERVRAFIEGKRTVTRSEVLKKFWRLSKAGVDPIIFWLVQDGLVSADPGRIGHACHARPEVYTWIGDGPGQSESEDEGG